MAVVNSFPLFFGAIYPIPADVLATADPYGDLPNNDLQGTADPGAGGTVPSVNDVRLNVPVGQAGTFGALVVPNPIDVRSPVTFDAVAVQQTGTCVVPSAADVQTGVPVDVSPSVGTFDSPLASTVEDGVFYGSGNEFEGTLDIDSRANLPAVGSVLDSVTYGVTNSFAGTYHSPEANEVWNLAVYGPSSSIPGTNRLPPENLVSVGFVYGPDDTLTGTLPGGSCDYPARQHVRSGIIYDTGSLTGDLVVPVVEDVRDGTVFDSVTVPQTGVLNLPAEADVRLATSFDDGNQTGTLDVFSEANLPSTSDVQTGVVFGNALTGIFDWPAQSDVKEGIGYGSAGNEFTGTLVVGAGKPVYPAGSDVLLGVLYGTEGILQFTGTLVTDADHPDEINVLDGIIYGSSAQFIGNRTDALETDVRLGVMYAANGISKTGQWDGSTGDPSGPGWIG